MALQYPEKALDSPILVQQGRVTEVRSNRTSGAMLLSQLPTVLVVLDAPSLADAARREFWSLAEEAAADEQVTVLRPEVALTAAPELKDCLSQVRCWRQLAAKNKTDFVLGAVLPVPPPAPPLSGPPGSTTGAAPGPASASPPATGPGVSTSAASPASAGPPPSSPPAAASPSPDRL